MKNFALEGLRSIASLNVVLGYFFSVFSHISPTMCAHIQSRNELRRFQELLDACESDRAMLRRDLSRLQDQLAEVTARRAQGCLIDLDYPYTPEVREWNRSPGGNFCRQLHPLGPFYLVWLARLHPQRRNLTRDCLMS
jgi:hypothetical protein